MPHEEAPGAHGLGAIAHYNLLERIGEGGLGEVYRARDTKVGRTVALKLAPPGFADGVRQHRLIEDARAAAGLSHPNIAWLFDVGHQDGRMYLAYEFVQGATLGQQMQGGPMNPRHALDLAVQVADALAEGHARGVLHKDIRPDTILETAKGSAKVLDFGLAVWTRGGQMRALAAAAPDSVSSDVRGAAYMSPEQARGTRVDGRSDVFSLAAITYEMLTGTPAFAGETPHQTIANIVHVTPPLPTSLNSRLPKLLDVLLMRALAKEAGSRTESAAKLAADFRRCRALLDLDVADAPVARSHAPQPPSDLLPIAEESGTGALWWLLIGLAAVTAAMLYLWLR